MIWLRHDRELIVKSCRLELQTGGNAGGLGRSWKLGGGIGTDTVFVLKTVIRPILWAELRIGSKTKSARI